MSILLGVALALGLSALPQQQAAAAGSSYHCTGFSGCASRGYGSAGYSSVYRQSHWNMSPGHNCVNYVAYRLKKDGVKQFTVPGQGTAKYWGGHARSKGISVSKSNPRPGDVAWFLPSGGAYRMGHVAYVESVNHSAGTVLVSEDNWGGNFHWRTYRFSQVAGFIHVAKGDSDRSSSASRGGSRGSLKKKLTKTPTPVISGTVKVGNTLKAKAGSWGPSGVKVTYQWWRGSKKISGATKSTYTVTSADRGKKIRVKVLGKKSGYASVTKTSAKSIRVK